MSKSELKIYGIEDLGKAKKVYINEDNYIAFECEKGIAGLFVNTDDETEAQYVDISNSKEIICLSLADKVIDLADGLEIKECDIYTSEGTITLNNGEEIYMELLRDVDIVDNESEYESVVLGIKVEFR